MAEAGGLLEQAIALAASGRLDAALAAAERGVERDPNDPRLRGTAGALLLALDRPAEAAVQLAEAALLEPKNATHRVGVGAALLAAHRPEDALVALDLALAIDPQSARAHANRAAALESLGRKPEAGMAALSSPEIYPHLPLP